MNLVGSRKNVYIPVTVKIVYMRVMTEGLEPAAEIFIGRCG